MALGGIEERKMYAEQCPAEFAQLAEQSTDDFKFEGLDPATSGTWRK